MARDIVVIDLLDLQRDDLVRAVGTIDGEPVEAFGWLSATTNHYDAADYITGPDGELSLRDGATPRRMTAQEIHDYATRLLDQSNPPAPVSLLS